MNVKLIDSCGLNKNHHNGLLSLSAFKRRKLVRSVAALTGAAICSITTIAHSLGLGEIQSSTFIGQPLKANIALVSLDGAIDLDTLIVRQVTREEADKLGVDISTGNQFKLEIDQGQGVPFIAVESREAIKEPYLNLLVELRWPNGVVYREYPILLDPPPKAPVVTAKRPESLQPRNVQPSPSSSSNPDAKSTVAGTRRLELDPLATADGKYRVQSGDTLSKIAERWRDGTDRGIYDTMQWLYENNLHAFTNQNIDLLRAGAVLQMPDLSAYVVDNEVPSQEEQAQAVQVKEPATEGGVKLSESDSSEKQAEDAVEHVDMAPQEPSRGLLTVGEANQDDTTREMIDMLVRENESLRARVEKIENSEYLETLKQLIVLQRQQISELRSRVGVSDSDNNEEIDSLLAKIGAENQQQTPENQLEVVVNDEKLATEDLSDTSEVELASENVTAKKAVDEELAPVKVDPVLSAPVMADNEQKNWLFWLILGGGAAIIAGFAGLLVYLRKTSTSSQQFAEAEKMDEELFEVLDDDSELSLDEVGSAARLDTDLDTKPVVTATPIRAVKSEKEQDTLVDDIQFDGDITLIQDPKKDEDENWLGDSAEVTESDLLDMDAAMKEVQDAFDDLLLDESVLEELEGEASLEGMTQELPSSGKNQAAEKEEAQEQEKESKKKPEPRTDDEVRLSIAEKMAQYNPEEYRKEIENLGLLELDELNDFDEEHDEIDTTVYRAMMFCEFKKFTKARELVQASLDEGIDDSRLTEALEQIDALEASGKNDSKQAG